MKIRGNTIGTTISPKRVVTNPGELTEEEKAQARAKIGAAAVGEGGNVDLSGYSTTEQVQGMINTAISNIAVYAGEVEDV